MIGILNRGSEEIDSGSISFLMWLRLLGLKRRLKEGAFSGRYAAKLTVVQRVRHAVISQRVLTRTIHFFLLGIRVESRYGGLFFFEHSSTTCRND